MCACLKIKKGKFKGGNYTFELQDALQFVEKHANQIEGWNTFWIRIFYGPTFSRNICDKCIVISNFSNVRY